MGLQLLQNREVASGTIKQLSPFSHRARAEDGNRALHGRALLQNQSQALLDLSPNELQSPPSVASYPLSPRQTTPDSSREALTVAAMSAEKLCTARFLVVDDKS